MGDLIIWNEWRQVLGEFDMMVKVRSDYGVIEDCLNGSERVLQFEEGGHRLDKRDNGGQSQTW